MQSWRDAQRVRSVRRQRNIILVPLGLRCLHRQRNQNSRAIACGPGPSTAGQPRPCRFELIGDSVELFENKLLLALVGATIGLCLAELTRRMRKGRLLMGTAMLPQFVVSMHEQRISVRMLGDYGIINESDLPITIEHAPHLLVYNAGSRAFQFKILPQFSDLSGFLRSISIPPNTETVLISHKACRIEVERCAIRYFPTFLWLESLLWVRLRDRKRYRSRARLYRATGPPMQGEIWYGPTNIEVSDIRARGLALPGKLLYQRRIKKLTHRQSN